MQAPQARIPRWPIAVPFIAWLVLFAAPMLPPGVATWLPLAVTLGFTVFSAVHHAEVIAHRIGEPFGTLVLAIAVTVIEVALIVSAMIAGGPEKAGLARDTVFAAIMIVCNGIVGLCLFVGGLHHREQGFELRGAAVAMSVLAALSVLTLVLPNYSNAVPGPMLSPGQLAFAGVVSLVLYGAFVFVQTVRHRDYFLLRGVSDESVHAAPPSSGMAWLSVGLLLVCLGAVVGLAKALSPTIENMVKTVGAQPALVGIIIASLVLLPEATAALRAARADRLQTALNLALGSALASIGLTIPVVAALFIWTGDPLLLGLSPKDSLLLFLSLIVSTLTLATGRTTILQGLVHLVVFAAFLVFALSP
jgi:Ca2+:H+ antiporter